MPDKPSITVLPFANMNGDLHAGADSDLPIPAGLLGLAELEASNHDDIALFGPRPYEKTSYALVRHGWPVVRRPVSHAARKIRAKGSHVPRMLRNMSKLFSISGATTRASRLTTMTTKIAAVVAGRMPPNRPK